MLVLCVSLLSVLQAKQLPGMTILYCSSPIYFANSELIFTEIRQVPKHAHTHTQGEMNMVRNIERKNRGVSN